MDRTEIGALDLRVSDRFGDWFDFGDDWWYQVNVESVADVMPGERSQRVTKRSGESPTRTWIGIR